MTQLTQDSLVQFKDNYCIRNDLTMIVIEDKFYIYRKVIKKDVLQS